jgi:aminoglycoside phosphotransferase (APT) family kinase protein
LQALGEALAELHASVLPGFGPITTDGSVASPQPILDALAAHARRIIRAPALAQAFLAGLRRHADLFDDPGPPTISHEDLHGFNVLLTGRHPPRLSTILDFDKAWAGPAESDIARLELWTGMSGAAFWGAYRARHPERTDSAQRRPIYQLLWCLEFAQNTKAHLRTTNALLHAVGLPPIDRFPQ